MQFRHEYKYQISYADYYTLRSRLRTVMRQDAHTGTEGTYRIRSLYFDNLFDKALREKLDGVDNREKFRIRYYNNDVSFIRLEKKLKQHGLCSKLSCPLTKEQTEAILQNDIEWMKDSKYPLLVELYSKMRGQLLKPKTIVEYEREPYIYRPGNVRITFDSQVRSGLHHTDLFDASLPTVAGRDDWLLLEVKYDAYLPEVIASLLQIQQRRMTAFSKYAVCRTYM